MCSVTQRIAQTHQPRGGYVPLKSMTVTQYDDGITLHPAENVLPGLVGTTVDYLTRFMLGDGLHAFRCALLGAERLSQRQAALDLVSQVTSLNYPSVLAACHLSAFDTALRAGIAAYRPLQEAPDRATYDNICTMVRRAQRLLQTHGPVTMSGFGFPGAYTQVVDSGDGDFLTTDTLWDFKVSVSPPNKNHTLQILMYLLMGIQSGQAPFRSVTHLGIYNPRLDREWRIPVADIAPDVVQEVACDVIGYARPVSTRVVQRRSWRALQ